MEEKDKVMAKEPIGFHLDNAYKIEKRNAKYDEIGYDVIKKIDEKKLYKEERDLVLSFIIETLSIKYGTTNYEYMYRGIATTIDTDNIEKGKYSERYELLQSAEYLHDIAKEIVNYINDRLIKEKLPSDVFHNKTRDLMSNLLYEISSYYRIITLNKLLKLPKKENNSYENYEYINNFLKGTTRK